MQHRCTTLTILLGLLFAACTPTVDVPAEQEAIRAVSAQWLEMAHAKDAAGVAALFAEDGAVYWDDRMPAVGPADIEAFMARNFAEGTGSGVQFGPERIDVAASGDLAVEHGTFQGARNQGRYLTVYRKTGDAWKVAADMSINTNPNGGAPDWARTQLDRWYERYNARDAQGLAELYTANARIGNAVGRTAIIALFEAEWDAQKDTCSGGYDGFLVVEPIAAGWGRDVCTMTGDDGSTTTAYWRWLAMYERQADGRWLIIRDRGERVDA